jgi:acetylornithine deacetylase/succinyl-diaminopimelate desuccinylase-like protein
MLRSTLSLQSDLRFRSPAVAEDRTTHFIGFYLEANQNMRKQASLVKAYGAFPAMIILWTSLALAAPPTPKISSQAADAFSKLQGNAKVKQGLEFIRNDDASTLADQKTIVAIPAPPYKEKVRAEYYMKRLQALGLKDVQMDSEGNVFGLRPGSGKGPKIFVEAHLDTVFPEGTNTQPVEKDGKIFAPGISDNTRGLAALLSIIRAFNATGISTVGDIIFCGTVGEEGLGNLRGMKAFFRDHKDIAASVDLDGANVKSITYLATGSHRYEIHFKGPGGHSFEAFGTPSAIHAMGRAIAKIGEVRTPRDPKTTFTVGMVSGGTSVNAIAAEASMLLDIRSNSQEELLRTESKILPLLQQAVDEENARWNSDKKITVETKLIGDRPAGSQPPDSMIVQASWMATKVIGQKPELAAASSTNANLPISIGVPAVTLGSGGEEGFIHAPGEWFDPTNAYLGPQKIFVTVLGLAGIDGVTQPLVPAP